MTDYSREVELVRKLGTVSGKLALLHLVASPIAGAGALLGFVSEAMLQGVREIDRASQSTLTVALGAWSLRYGRDRGMSQRSDSLRGLVGQCRPIATLQRWSGESAHFVDAWGIPVAYDTYPNSPWFYSPGSADEVLNNARRVGTRWIVDKDGALHVDTSLVPGVLCGQTQEIIARTRLHKTCRAWVLWGPPRGGKSVAARQIALALTGGWMRICGAAARSNEAWAAARALGAEAIILDDLDTAAGLEDDLLGYIETARTHCRVIISTMNVLPNAEAPATGDVKPDVKSLSTTTERKRYELRGAILAPGRAADERPRHYATLDESVRRALAPNVPESLRAPDLLAAYLVELETRQRACGSVTQADLDEMRERMAAVGER